MNLPFSGNRALLPHNRAKGVTAILGPTNTGKTHYAIERMLAHPTGIIGLPLRLLAREVYNRAVARVGSEHVALITGEEKIKPKNPRYWISTVEAMPRHLDVAFVAIDEIQLAGDLDRGHVFTDRLLNRRGRDETLIIGAMTMRRAVEQLLADVTIVSRPRLSKLSFAGARKLSRLPPRSAVVAFSAEEVYAIAELVRRQRGGAAVVLGALSPRTRNAQVALYQNGDVDYIIATDAIGMGLNLDVDHIAFASDRKFDGWQFRRLTAAEFGQIAGRAGRHLSDGSFGTTGRCPPFDEDLIENLENHAFDPVGHLQWRNSDLGFATIEALQASLDKLPEEAGLTRAPLAEDVLILDIAAHDEDIRRAAKTRADVERLWDACQIPDYRKVSLSAHAELVLAIYRYIVRAGRIPDEWFSRQLAQFDRIDGDIDTLSARIAQVRTCTYIANRADWLADPEHWQGVARQVEDKLSDALHERLAQRFVDRRTSVLMRRLRENAMLEAEITASGDVLVEGQHIGHLQGFRFTPDPQAAGEAARALNTAAQKALAGEIDARANRLREAVDEAFVIANDGIVRWLGEAVGKIAAGDKALAPRIRVLADEQLSGAPLEAVQRRLDLWLAQHLKKLLGPLIELETGEGLDGLARGIAFQVAESLGVLERSRVAEDVKALDQTARAVLRKLGLRFGAYHIYLPQLLKPAPRALAAQLWALMHGGVEQARGLDEVPHLAASGRTSFVANKDIPKGLYRAAGFRVCGERAVRVDILERLADLVRPAINYRPGMTPGDPPPGAADGDAFVVTVAMTSLAGCSGEDFASILHSLGYVSERRKGPAITVPLVPLAGVEPVKPLSQKPSDKEQAATPAAADAATDDAHGAQPHGAEPQAVVPHDAEPHDAEPHGAGDVAAAETVVKTQANGDGQAVEIAAQTKGVATEPSALESIDPDRPESGLCLDAPGEAPNQGGSPQDEPAQPVQASEETDRESEAATAIALSSGDRAWAGGTPEPLAAQGPDGSTAPSTEAEAAVSRASGNLPSLTHTVIVQPAATEIDIEVWRRPRRHQPHGRRFERHERAGGRSAAAKREVPPVASDPVAASVAPAVAPAPRPDARQRRADPAHGGRPRGSHHEPRPEGGGGRGLAAPRPERAREGRHNERRGDKMPYATTAKNDRERLPDPDSPFAKLLALKAELENKAKKD
jgi:ATP-dependent RNA helicase SUPV3L1/SUV3